MHTFRDSVRGELSKLEISLEIFSLKTHFATTKPKTHFATTKPKPLKSVQNVELKLTNQQMEKFPELRNTPHFVGFSIL